MVTDTADLILIGVLIGVPLIGVLLIFTVAMRHLMRKIGQEFKGIGESMEGIEQKAQAVGKLFTGLVIGLVKASNEQRPLTGKDLAEGLKMVEESKTTEELLEKLSTPELVEGKGEELKKEKSRDDNC